MIAVDAPVLIELLTDGPRADAVEAGLRQSLGSGRVVVCDAALAQLCASLRNGAEALAALEEMGVHFNAVEAKSALRAGEMQRRHRQREGDARPIAAGCDCPMMRGTQAQASACMGMSATDRADPRG